MNKKKHVLSIYINKEILRVVYYFNKYRGFEL